MLQAGEHTERFYSAVTEARINPLAETVPLHFCKTDVKLCEADRCLVLADMDEALSISELRPRVSAVYVWDHLQRPQFPTQRSCHMKALVEMPLFTYCYYLKSHNMLVQPCANDNVKTRNTTLSPLFTASQQQMRNIHPVWRNCC